MGGEEEGRMGEEAVLIHVLDNILWPRRDSNLRLTLRSCDPTSQSQAK